MSKYKVRYTDFSVKPPKRNYFNTEELSTLRFPRGGCASIFTKVGISVAHGSLRKDRDYAGGYKEESWMITDKMLLAVDRFNLVSKQEYRIRYTNLNVTCPEPIYSTVPDLGDQRFPEKGHLVIYAEKGVVITEGYLRKGTKGWKISGKMLKDVRQYVR